MENINKAKLANIVGGSERREDGSVRLLLLMECPTCKCRFKPAPRCPECGQLVEIERR